jgi:hypothetical protein
MSVLLAGRRFLGDKKIAAFAKTIARVGVSKPLPAAHGVQGPIRATAHIFQKPASQSASILKNPLAWRRFNKRYPLVIALQKLQYAVMKDAQAILMLSC